MKKKSWFVFLLVGIIPLLLVACNLEKRESDFVDDVEKTQKVEMVSAANSEVIGVISEDKDIESFVHALKMDEWDWDVVTIPSEAVEDKAFKMYRKSAAKWSFSKENKLDEVAVITTYKDHSYIKLNLKKVSLSFQVPEDVYEYLRSLEI